MRGVVALFDPDATNLSQKPFVPDGSWVSWKDSPELTRCVPRQPRLRRARGDVVRLPGARSRQHDAPIHPRELEEPERDRRSGGWRVYVRLVPVTASRSGWVIYWGGQQYLADPMTRGEVYRWTGDQHAKRGDVALLYATAPVSALVAVFDVVTGGRPSKWAGQFRAHAFEMDVRLRRWFRSPLPLALMRADPKLRQWGLVRASFQMPFGRPPPIADDALRYLLRTR